MYRQSYPYDDGTYSTPVFFSPPNTYARYNGIGNNCPPLGPTNPPLEPHGYISEYPDEYTESMYPNSTPLEPDGSSSIARGRTSSITPRQAGLVSLPRMEESPPRSYQPQHTHPSDLNGGTSTSRGGSVIYNIFGYFRGLRTFSVALSRSYEETHDAVVAKLNELGIRYDMPRHSLIQCTSGQRGTSDYVTFYVNLWPNDHPHAVPGGDTWYCKMLIQKTGGNGNRFRELGRKVFDAAKYSRTGGVWGDHTVLTWGGLV